MNKHTEYLLDKHKSLLEPYQVGEEEILEQISLPVWTKLAYFLKNLSDNVNIPQIYKSPYSSVDVLWENDKYQLLLNFSEDNLIDFYGDNKETALNNKKIFIKGTLDPTVNNNKLIEFFMEQFK